MKLTVSQLRSIIAEEVKAATRLSREDAKFEYGESTGFDGPVEYTVIVEKMPGGYSATLSAEGIRKGAVDKTWGSMHAQELGMPHLFSIASGKGMHPTREKAIAALQKAVMSEIGKLGKGTDLRSTQAARLEVLQGFLDNGSANTVDVNR